MIFFIFWQKLNFGGIDCSHCRVTFASCSRESSSITIIIAAAGQLDYCSSKILYFK